MKKYIGILSLLLIFCISSFSTVFAADDAGELTIDQAVKMAVNNNNKIKELSESKSTIEYKLREARSNLISSSSTDEITTYVQQMVTYQLQLSLLEPDKQKQKDQLTYSLSNYFAQIIAQENELALLDKSLLITKDELDIEAMKLQLGLISQSDYDTSEYQYETAKLRMETLSTSLDTYYRQLNDVMGQKKTNRYTLVLDLEYEPLGADFNVSRAVTRAIEQSSNIKTLENNVYLAQYQINTISYDSFSVTDQLEILKNNLYSAQRALEDGKDDIENNLRSTYESVIKLEKSYESTTLELAKAKSDLEILETKLELGQITELEVRQKRHSIEELEESLRSTIYEHAVSIMPLKNPGMTA